MQRCPQENIGAGGGRGEEGGGSSHVAMAPAMEPKAGGADVTMEAEAPQVDHIANLDAYIKQLKMATEFVCWARRALQIEATEAELKDLKDMQKLARPLAACMQAASHRLAKCKEAQAAAAKKMEEAKAWM